MQTAMRTLTQLYKHVDIELSRCLLASHHRALRPLRAASRAEGIRLVVAALFKAIPALGNVALVAGLFYFIFAILAVSLLSGGLYACSDSSGERLDAYYILGPDMGINKTW